MFKTVILVLVLAVVIGVVFWVLAPRFLNKTDQSNKLITLTVWGLFETEEEMRPLLELYKTNNPNVTVNYVQQSTLNYRTRVQTQIVNSQGPDVYIIHNTWLPMFLKVNTIYPAPSGIVNFNDYTKIFYPVAKDTLTKNNNVYAIPKTADGLALYYNEDILKATNAPVPQNWEQFTQSAIKTTVIDQSGQIISAGAGIGTANNIDYFSDILGLLFYQQPKALLDQPSSPQSADVLKFYTDFALNPQKKVWDQTLESSTQSFIKGKLAFYFAPATKINDIKQANPTLNFKIVPVPQLPGKNISWGSFWAYTVSSKSPNPDQSWEFIKYLTSADTQLFINKQLAAKGLIGAPYSRVDLQSQQIQDPLLGAFVFQAPFYKSWYLSSQTSDQGINDEIIKYYQDAVNLVLQGQTPASALGQISNSIREALIKYSPSP